MAFSVDQRRHEIGVRLALGARDSHIVRLVLRRGMGLAVGGIILGVGGALVLTRWMSSVMYEVHTADAGIYLGMVTLLAAVGLVANYLPARRVLRSDTLRPLSRD